MTTDTKELTPEEIAEREAFAEKVRSLSFSTGAANSNRKAEKRLDADMAAYKRLRATGEQPPEIKGSAELEAKAGSTHEISAGHIVRDKRARNEVDRILTEAKAES